jgi:16S rRNA processing protein RimM
VNEFYLIATVSSAFGKNGAVKIISHSDFPERFLDLSEVYIDFFNNKKLFFVENVEQHNNVFTIKFRNFDSDKDVTILIGKDIFVDEGHLVKLPKDHFFIHDLIGSRVVRNDLELGIIKDVLKYPANDIYVVFDSRGKEILIPAVMDFIDSFDSVNKILKLKPGEELYDDDET